MSIEDNHDIQDWVRFLHHPTAYHVVETVIARLREAGFQPLSFPQPVGHTSSLPKLENGGGYFLSTGGTLIAFRLPHLGAKDWENLRYLPLRLWGAHTDSPALKVKPRPTINRHQHLQIGLEVYGGAILNTWLDRPLAVAGRLFTAQKGSDHPQVHLINLNDPEMMVVIPNAAIHLNRNVNKEFALIPDTHLPALWGVQSDHAPMENQEDWLARLAKRCGVVEDVLAHDLFLYDPQSPVLWGQDKSFINASRLDNLAMVHAGLQGFLRARGSLCKLPHVSALAFFNHEEIGSMTYEGAASGLPLKAIESFYDQIHSLAPQLDNQAWTSISQSEESFIISADMSHGFHPNYEAWYESNHRPLLNKGVVIKYNPSFRYASSGASIAKVKQLLQCFEPALPVQEYLHHADIPCGSTIGPLISGRLAIPTVDIGNSLWAMHSIRETAGVQDHLMMIELAERFFKGQS